MHKLSKIRPLIGVTLFSKKNDTYYTATCPLCGLTWDATVLGSDKYAKIAAIGKVITHLKLDHKAEVENDEKEA